MKQSLIALSLIAVGASFGQAESLSYESFSGYKAETKLKPKPFAELPKDEQRKILKWYAELKNQK